MSFLFVSFRCRLVPLSLLLLLPLLLLLLDEQEGGKGQQLHRLSADAEGGCELSKAGAMGVS